MSSTGVQRHVLYFSTKCRFCQAFMEELIKTPFVREVAAICVDPSPTRPPLPSWLKSVPTLVVGGESSPRVGPGPVNNWLFERRMGGTAPPPTTTAPRNSVTMMPAYSADAGPPRSAARGEVSVASNGRLPAAVSASTEGDKSASPPVLAGSTDDSKVSPYFNLEMSGKSWSDIYSFLNAMAASGSDAVNPITRNFELLGALGIGGGGAAGGAAAGGGPSARVSEKEAALLREFEAYAAGRDRDVKGPLTRR